TYTPGLTLIPHHQTIGGTMAVGTKLAPAAACSSPTGVPFVGGTAQIAGTGNMACLTSQGGGTTGTATGTFQITWYDSGTHVAGHSTVTWTEMASGAAPIMNVTFTSGDLAGAKAVLQLVPNGVSGNCLLNPVVGATFSSIA